MTVCRSCGAPIVWADTESGARMPVDAEPTEDGNILLREKAVGKPPEAHVVDLAERVNLARQCEYRGEKLRLFVPHFATCPDADEHRKSRS